MELQNNILQEIEESEQRKKGELQNIILQEIEEKGIQSPSTLDKKLNPRQKKDFNAGKTTERKPSKVREVKIPNSIYKAFDSLSSSKQNKIEKILEEDGDQGTSTTFYGFTESYLKEKANESNCTLEDLWEIVLNTFVGDYTHYIKTRKKKVGTLLLVFIIDMVELLPIFAVLFL